MNDIFNEEVRDRIPDAIGKHAVEKEQNTSQDDQEKEQNRNRDADNVKDRTGLVFRESVRVMKDRVEWCALLRPNLLSDLQ